MLDTIHLWFPSDIMRPSDSWQETITRHDEFTKVRRYLHNIGPLRMTLGSCRNAGSRFTAEVSLPYLLHGHNIKLLSLNECRSALALMHRRIVASARWLDVPKLDEFRVSRVDFCYCWRVPNPDVYVADIARAYGKPLSQKVSRFQDVGDEGEGWMSENQYWSLVLYNKHAETLNRIRTGQVDWTRCGLTKEELLDLARGVLRFEARVKTKNLKRAVLRADSTVGNLLAHLDYEGLAFLRKRWRAVTAHWQPTDDVEVLDRLQAAYTKRKAASLAALRTFANQIGLEEYRRRYGLSPKALRCQVKDLESVGVGLGEQFGLRRLEVEDGLLLRRDAA